MAVCLWMCGSHRNAPVLNVCVVVGRHNCSRPMAASMLTATASSIFGELWPTWYVARDTSCTHCYGPVCNSSCYCAGCLMPLLSRLRTCPTLPLPWRRSGWLHAEGGYWPGRCHLPCAGQTEECVRGTRPVAKVAQQCYKTYAVDNVFLKCS